MQPFVFQRGETILLALDAVQGNVAQVSAVTAALKPVAAGRMSVDTAAPLAASFGIANRAAAGDVPGGWTLTIAAPVSATLAPGSYLADAKLVAGNSVIVTEPIAIRINEAVTP